MKPRAAIDSQFVTFPRKQVRQSSVRGAEHFDFLGCKHERLARSIALDLLDRASSNRACRENDSNDVGCRAAEPCTQGINVANVYSARSVLNLDEQVHVVTDGKDVRLPWSRRARIMMYSETIVPKQPKHFQLQRPPWG